MVFVLLLLLVTIGLFWRMNQVQREVTDALTPLRRPTPLATGACARFSPLDRRRAHLDAAG